MKPLKPNNEILENNKICTIIFSVFSSYLLHRRLLSSKGSIREYTSQVRPPEGRFSHQNVMYCTFKIAEVLLAESVIASRAWIVFTSLQVFKSWKLLECKLPYRLVIFENISNLCLKFTALSLEFLTFTQVRFWFFQILKLDNECLNICQMHTFRNNAAFFYGEIIKIPTVKSSHPCGKFLIKCL